MVGIDGAIGKNNDVEALRHFGLCLLTHTIEGLRHARRTQLSDEADVQSVGAEGVIHLLVDVSDLLEIHVAEYGLADFETLMGAARVQSRADSAAVRSTKPATSRVAREWDRSGGLVTCAKHWVK